VAVFDGNASDRFVGLMAWWKVSFTASAPTALGCLLRNGLSIRGLLLKL
jgi:hypothetical protein